MPGTVRNSTLVALVVAAVFIPSGVQSHIVSVDACLECGAFRNVSSAEGQRHLPPPGGDLLRIANCTLLSKRPDHEILLEAQVAMRKYRSAHSHFARFWSQLDILYVAGGPGQSFSFLDPTIYPPLWAGDRWSPRGAGVELVITKASRRELRNSYERRPGRAPAPHYRTSRNGEARGEIGRENGRENGTLLICKRPRLPGARAGLPEDGRQGCDFVVSRALLQGAPL